MTPIPDKHLSDSAADTEWIHVNRAEQPDEDPSLSGKALKLMHRFKAVEVENKMDEAEAI